MAECINTHPNVWLSCKAEAAYARLTAPLPFLFPFLFLLPPAVWAAECTDTHPSCQFWASNSECFLNPGYMLFNCKTACEVPLCVGTDGETEPRTDAVG